MTRNDENENKESITLSNNAVKNELIRRKIREYKTKRKKWVKNTRRRNKQNTQYKTKRAPENTTRQDAPENKIKDKLEYMYGDKVRKCVEQYGDRIIVFDTHVKNINKRLRHEKEKHKKSTASEVIKSDKRMVQKRNPRKTGKTKAKKKMRGQSSEKEKTV